MRVKFNHFTVAILNVTLDCQNMFKTRVQILMHQSWRNEIEAIFPQFLSSKVKRNEAEEFSPVPELEHVSWNNTLCNILLTWIAEAGWLVMIPLHSVKNNSYRNPFFAKPRLPGVAVARCSTVYELLSVDNDDHSRGVSSHTWDLNLDWY